MSRGILGLLAAALIALPVAVHATEFELIDGTDATAGFDQPSGQLTTSAPDADLSLPFDLNGAALDITLTIGAGGETAFTIGTVFSGTVVIGGIADPLLVMDVDSIIVTGIAPGASGSPGTSFTLGGLDTASQSEGELIGGSAAARFGGIGTIGQLSIVMRQMTGPPPFYLPGAFFGGSFTGDMDSIQILFHTPEPNTALLVGLPLLGMAAWRRRQARR